MEFALHCPSCGWGYPDALLLRTEGFSCPGCSAVTRVQAFPRLWNKEGGAGAAATQEEGEASCYYHAQKRASQSCGECGRFICALCDVGQGEDHRCPRCIRGLSAAKEKEADGPAASYFRWDMGALGIAVLSSAFFFFFIHFFITGPVLLFLVVRHWRRRPSLAMDTRQKLGHYTRLLAAGLVGLAQVAWALFLVALLFREWR